MVRSSLGRAKWRVLWGTGLLLACSSHSTTPETNALRTRDQHQTATANQLVLDLTLAQTPLRLLLTPAESPAGSEYTSYEPDASGQLRPTKRKVPTCLYQAQVLDPATDQPLPDAYASLSTCVHPHSYPEGSVYGLIVALGQSWTIEPLPLDPELSDGITHQVKDGEALRFGLPAPAQLVDVRKANVVIPEVAAFREGLEHETKYLELMVAHDGARLQQFSGDVDAMMSDSIALVATANTILENSGLTPRLRVALLGQVSVPDEAYEVAPNGPNEISSDSLLSQFNEWSTKNLPAHDQHTLLSGYNFDGGTVGLAHLGSICSGTTSGLIAQTANNGAIAAQVVVHELGHNLSMAHDSENNTCPQSGYIMAAYVQENGLQNPQFSTCSLEYFSNLLSQAGGPSCLNNVPTELAVDHCGDAVVSGLEQCDCGAADCASIDPCCDGSTCQLSEGSTCSDFNDLCCSSCQIASKGTVCRPARDECDAAESCVGFAATCPADLFFTSGTVCTNADYVEGLCFRGSCASREAQCTGIGESLVGEPLKSPEGVCPPADNVCGDSLCYSPSENACFIMVGMPVVEGAGCGEGQQCQAGACISSASIDDCPLDELKMAPGICGCGVADVDTDLDLVYDCDDICPVDALKEEPGTCGCGQPDPNATGITSCQDSCPTDQNKEAPGMCGCNALDTDTDSDGTADCQDLCPQNPDPGATPANACVTPLAVSGEDSTGSGAADSAGSGSNTSTTGSNADSTDEKKNKGCGCRIEAHHEPSLSLVWPSLAFGLSMVGLRRRGTARRAALSRTIPGT